MAEDPPAPPRGIPALVRAFFARWDPYLVTLIGLSLVKVYYARVLAIPQRDIGLTLLLETAWIVAVLGLVDLSRKRRPYLLDLAAYTVMCIAMVANALYAQMFGAPIDPRMLTFAAQVGDVQASVFDMIRRTHVLMLADIPFLLVAALLIARANRNRPRLPRRRWKQGIVVGVAVIVLAGQVGSALTLPADIDPVMVIARRGLGTQQIASLVRVPFTSFERPARASTAGTATTDPTFQARIEAVRRGSVGERLAAFSPGTYKGSDVIVIQVESLLTFAVGARIEGKQVTPNLDALIAESWYFPNTFSQVGVGNTSDAEFSATSGMLAPMSDPATLVYADRIIPAIPRLLRAQGYEAVTMHTNHARFWNRDQLYPALGFGRWYDHTYFVDRDPMWHASDQTLFTYGMKALDPLRVAQKPFYAQLITMTSHHPYRYPVASRRPLKLSASNAAAYLGRYAGSISYADMAIGEFIAALKANGLYEKSIIVVFGDHTGLPESGYSARDKAIMSEMIGRSLGIADRQRVPLIVHLPGQTQGSLSRETLGQVDIMPTLADALGLDISAVPHVGKSAFVSSPGLVQTRAYLPAGTTITDTTIFVPGATPSEGKAYAVEDGRPIAVTPDDLAAYERARQLTALSAEWMLGLPERPDAARVMDRGW